MSARERELAQRHLALLTDMRDAAWLHVHRAGNSQKAMMEHEALNHAVALAQAEVDRLAAKAA